MLVRNDVMQVAICQIVTLFVGNKTAIKIRNLNVAYWLNILCKRGGVSNGIIAYHAVAYLHFHLPEFIDPKNWPANSLYLSPVDFSVWGALQ